MAIDQTAILKTMNFFPLIISSFFIFESVANTSIKSAIVVFGALLVTFFGKLIKLLLRAMLLPMLLLMLLLMLCC